MISKHPGTLALCACLLFAACATDPVSGKRNFSLVDWTPEEEREMGREFAPNIEAEFEAIYPDAEANAYLGELVARMVELSPRHADFDFHFKILNSSVPNALALPGGYVYITRGLLEELETEGQFIAVMGHELGHVEHRHAMLNQTRGILGWSGRALGSVGRALPIGGRVVNAVGGIVSAPSVLLGLKFNRSQELEADERGVYFAAEMGYNPLDAVQTFELFQRMEDEQENSTSQVSILRTHPVNAARIESIQKIVARDYPEWANADTRPATVETDPRFGDLVARMREHAPAYVVYDRAFKNLAQEEPDLDAAQADLDEARSLLPDEPLFWILAGELAAMVEDVPRSAVNFQVASRLYQRRTPGDGHWKPPLYLGLYALLAEQSDAAVKSLEVAVARYPMNPTAHLLLGHALAHRGDTQAAGKEYKRVMGLTPRKDPLHVEARTGLDALAD